MIMYKKYDNMIINEKFALLLIPCVYLDARVLRLNNNSRNEKKKNEYIIIYYLCIFIR